MTQAVKLADQFYVISGDKLTHPWDASAYLFAGDEPVLIDCGSTEGYPALKRNLAQLGLKPRDIRKVLATHCHWDHVSGFGLLSQESDAQLFIHETERAAVETGDPEMTASFIYDKPFPPAAVSGHLQEGETIYAGNFELKVIHTPGHSPGGVSFIFAAGPMKVLIAGDTLWGGFHSRIGSDIEAWRKSLDKILSYDFDLYTFGHLPPTLVYDAKTKIEEARKQLGVYYNPWFKPFYETFKY